MSTQYCLLMVNSCFLLGRCYSPWRTLASIHIKLNVNFSNSADFVTIVVLENSPRQVDNYFQKLTPPVTFHLRCLDACKSEEKPCYVVDIFNKSSAKEFINFQVGVVVKVLIFLIVAGFWGEDLINLITVY